MNKKQAIRESPVFCSENQLGGDEPFTDHEAGTDHQVDRSGVPFEIQY